MFNGLRQQNGEAGDDKPHHAGEHYRATANAIRQRPKQPLQKHAASQIGGHGCRYPLDTSVELLNHRQHTRLNHIVADIG
ncbi:hypothetical protein D3C85_1271400 [compost metagenome]